VARITSRWLLRGGIATLGLNQSDGLVLLAIVDRANEQGIAWPSQYKLATDLGIARSTVQAALGRLVEHELLLEHEPGRQGRSARYQLARLPGQLRAVN